jgi:hypothetical protein
METRNPEKESLLEHYSNEVCSHVEAAISLFFGLIGTLIIMTVVNTFAARIVFSVMYFVLGGLGIYFYVRLFYYRKLLEGILLDEPYKDYHIKLQDRAFKESGFGFAIKLTQKISRDCKREYRMIWAWTMLLLAGATAISA